MFKIGPTVMQGVKWDEDGRTQLAEILISHQQDVINSIRFSYFINERLVHSQTYGQPNGLKFNMVQFHYQWPCEDLICLWGEYKNGKLASIGFDTTLRSYGPFGSTGSRSDSNAYLYQGFKYEFKRGRFGGFHGSCSGGSVSAIGVYVKPIC